MMLRWKTRGDAAVDFHVRMLARLTPTFGDECRLPVFARVVDVERVRAGLQGIADERAAAERAGAR